MFYVLCNYVTMTCDNFMWHFVIVMCDIMPTTNSKSKIKNKMKNKIEIRKKIIVYYLWFWYK